MKWIVAVLVIACLGSQIVGQECRTALVTASFNSDFCAQCSFCVPEDTTLNTDISCLPCSSYKWTNNGEDKTVTKNINSAVDGSCVNIKFESDFSNERAAWSTDCYACFNGEGSCEPSLSLTLTADPQKSSDLTTTPGPTLAPLAEASSEESQGSN